jgi:RAT1-interacting protein
MVNTVASLRVGPAAEYAGACPKFSKPKEVACFSRDAGRRVQFDRRGLREYAAPHLPAPLDVGFETYIPKDNVDDPAPLRDVFSALAHHQHSPAGSIVTYRNNLNKLMLCPYSRRDDWEIGVSRQANNCLVLNVRETARKAAEEARRSEKEERMAYWGYKFEDLSTRSPGGSGGGGGGKRRGGAEAGSEDTRRIPSPCDPESYKHLYPPDQLELLRSLHAAGSHGRGSTQTVRPDAAAGAVNANEEFCAVLRLKLADTVIVMAAECDCEEISQGGERRYVELKTSKLLREQRDRVSFEKHKLLKFWLQSFLAGVPKIVVGFRENTGVVQQIQAIETLSIPRMVRAQGHWDPSVCLNFGQRALEWLARQMASQREGEELVLRYEPEQESLLLLAGM